MNSLLTAPEPPHHLFDARFSPSPSMSHNTTNSRKRKADDDSPPPPDHRMSSPSISPLPASRPLPTAAHRRHHHAAKRSRSTPIGRPLTLPRLLETLDASQLRTVLSQLCTTHPSLTPEVEHTSPRPTVPSTLAVLKGYESSLHAAFPFGGDPRTDYAYNRVRNHLLALLDALQDFVPHFLPPHEGQVTQSLQFLDGATGIIMGLPDWHTYQNQIHKQNAFEEICGAWVLVVREAGKRAGGVQLVHGGWDAKIREWNRVSGGRLQDAVDALAETGVGSAGSGVGQGQGQGGGRSEINSIRQEMLGANYGSNLPVRVGPW